MKENNVINLRYTGHYGPQGILDNCKHISGFGGVLYLILIIILIPSTMGERVSDRHP